MKYDIGETELWYSTVTEKYPEGKIIYNFTDAALHTMISTPEYLAEGRLNRLIEFRQMGHNSP